MSHGLVCTTSVGCRTAVHWAAPIRGQGVLWVDRGVCLLGSLRPIEGLQKKKNLYHTQWCSKGLGAYVSVGVAYATVTVSSWALGPRTRFLGAGGVALRF